MPTATLTPIPSPTFTPTATLTPRPTVTETPVPPTATPIVVPTLPPTSTPVHLPEQFIFGQSVQGRNLTARRIGQGNVTVMLVGGTHGGWEANTVTLVEQFIAHFEANPGQVLPGIRLVFVPALNPDGLALGQTYAGRLHANGVDLHRNWGCGWEPTAFFRDQEVNPGPEPFSEPETVALAALINDTRPAAVLFYHSAANGVFAGRCNGEGNAAQMAAVLGQATGYSYGEAFTEYVVSGTASTWVDGLGIPSAEVELASSDSTEFNRNLRGVMALQCWLLGQSAAGIPACSR